ncbi:uncharacterized protein LOC114325577 isoform X1 [Diabrotica virgifera virgifera]|uniref:Uncharacterized protein LOC114325577 isoform X1 n=1 Tax=Diabrotica virgifera virgifera TaxID=50390 RepID=A0A6P7F293_DIAVI|nr:uncharacterized protein LOC114325577 isoform X1 [Diabrotica virgifera virgifera]
MCNVPPKFYQLCRLCLSHDKDNALFIFDKAAMERNILKKIMTCLSILVSEKDELPHVICFSCSEQIEYLYKFNELAKKTEGILHQFLVYTKELQGSDEEKMHQSEKLLENLRLSLTMTPQNLKVEAPEPPSSNNKELSHQKAQHPTVVRPPEIKSEPPIFMEQTRQTYKHVDTEPVITPKVEIVERIPSPPTPPQDLSMDLSKDSTEHEEPSMREPLIKVKPASVLQQYPPEPQNLPEITTSPMVHQDFSSAPIEPTDLSNKRMEKVTCVPEISFIKEEADAVSISSNSSDPERLEVDMSQINEEHSDSTLSETSPTSEPTFNHSDVDPAVLQALSRNGYNPPLSGEASQLLRKLITCRKLGMTITPAQPHVLNYTLFDEQQKSLEHTNAEKSRRKQSYPSKASVSDSVPMDQDEEEEYGPDFTGNSPWCNMVKGKRVEVPKRVALSCTNCGTQTTTIWRRNLRGEMVCNACGLYFKLHNIDRPVTMRRDTIHTRRRRPKAAEREKADYSPVVGNFVNPPVHTYKAYKAKIVKVSASKERRAAESSDTDDMLSALRRQLRPHLVMALQGHRNNSNENMNLDSSPKVPSRAHIQGPTVPNFLPIEKMPSVGVVSAREADSDEDSIADLPLNLVSTQMTEGELI